MATDPSAFEYTVKATSLTAVAKSGARFPFSDRLAEHSNNPNASSSMGQGSGAYPTHHVKPSYEPSFSFAIPIDESERFFKWFQKNCVDNDGPGVCDLERRRKKARVAAVVDIFRDFLPLPGEESFSDGEGTMTTIEGGYLKPNKDITNALQS